MPWEFSLNRVPLLAAEAVDRAAHLRDDETSLIEGWPTAIVLRLDERGRFRAEVAETPEETFDVATVDAGNTPGSAGDLAGDLRDTKAELAGRHLRLLFEPAFDFSEHPPHHAVFLGMAANGRHVWAMQADNLGNAGVTDLRSSGEFLLPHDAALVAEALALIAWHKSDPFARSAGLPLQRSLAGWTGHDSSQTAVEFPRTDPAVICLVHDGSRKILLARNAQWTDSYYSVLAGFVEAGESLENCVRREVREEVGLTVEGVSYLGSQPWPFPRSLMVAFHAIADPTRPLEATDGEIAHAMWLDVEEVKRALMGQNPKVILPGRISIARVMIESWVDAVDHAAAGLP